MAKAAYIGVKQKNMLPLALAENSNGDVYYNEGLGYRTGYRINSSGSEVELATQAVTGFIPITQGQTFYTNFSLNPNMSTVLGLYDENFDLIKNATGTATNLIENNKTSYFTYGTYGTGYYVTISTSATVNGTAYFRLNARNTDLNENAIITIDNEYDKSLARKVKNMYIGIGDALPSSYDYVFSLPKDRIKGDVNNDGKFDDLDVSLIRKHIINMQIITDPGELWSANVDSSVVEEGSTASPINITDALWVRQIILNKRKLGSLGNSYSGIWIANENYETELGQFYTDIDISNVPTSSNLTIWDEKNIVTNVIRNGSSLRVYVTRVPHENVNMYIKLSTENKVLHSVAKKIKKAYIGDANGIARLFFSSELLLSYYGTTTTPLSVARHELAATSIGGYALFGGGYGTDSQHHTSADVDYYDNSLTKKVAPSLGTARTSLCATSVGNYALFAGGDTKTAISSTVDYYDSSLTTHAVHTYPLRAGSRYGAMTTVGSNAVYAGGSTTRSNGTTTTAIATGYDSSLTRNDSVLNLNGSGHNLAATSVGNYAIFAGGKYGSGNFYRDTITVYNSSLTRQETSTTLSVGRAYLAATSLGDYAIFAGGKGPYITDSDGTFLDYGSSDVVDLINTSLTRSITDSLSVKRGQLAATTVGDYALFAGGNGGYVQETTGATITKGTVYNTVDVYDSSITRSTSVILTLSSARYKLGATTLGNYALFAGGSMDSANSDTVDVYQIS